MAKIRKIMLTDAPTLKKGAKAEEAAKLLLKSQHSCVIIIADNGSPIGIVTELDILKNISSKGSAMTTVDKIMSCPVTAMNLNIGLEEALKIIDEKKFRKYPVIDNNKLVGLVTKKDIVRNASENIRLHRNIQNLVLVLFVLFELFVFVFYRKALA